jgi:YHS domain-containing protein
MKRLFAGLLATMILITLWGCTPDSTNSGETTEATAPAEVLRTGWQVIDGEKYCFTEAGEPVTGWISDFVDGESVRYYLSDTGKVATFWQEIGGKRYYFGPEGVMTTGWLDLEEGSYYFGMDGALFTGLLNIKGQGYYFGEDGRRYTGWLETDGRTYYFGEDGVMAVGTVEIAGQTHHFSPHGVKILLVNPWNSLPKDYEVELVNVTERDRLETVCAEALQRMLADCEAAGYKPMIVSAYRTQEEQDFLYQRKVDSLLDQKWEPEKAKAEAAKSVAVPGTSERQLGLGVDIIDSNYGYLDD